MYKWTFEITPDMVGPLVETRPDGSSVAIYSNEHYESARERFQNAADKAGLVVKAVCISGPACCQIGGLKDAEGLWPDTTNMTEAELEALFDLDLRCDQLFDEVLGRADS